MGVLLLPSDVQLGSSRPRTGQHGFLRNLYNWRPPSTGFLFEFLSFHLQLASRSIKATRKPPLLHSLIPSIHPQYTQHNLSNIPKMKTSAIVTLGLASVAVYAQSCDDCRNLSALKECSPVWRAAVGACQASPCNFQFSSNPLKPCDDAAAASAQAAASSSQAAAAASSSAAEVASSASSEAAAASESAAAAASSAAAETTSAAEKASSAASSAGSHITAVASSAASGASAAASSARSAVSSAISEASSAVASVTGEISGAVSSATSAAKSATSSAAGNGAGSVGVASSSGLVGAVMAVVGWLVL
ncbi:hypothetical protein K440DRAFT_274069 [Wilcoxina mikolae CBS 423.85]|nr:hypothetical protein K440DRAFT_274069 [Wilcoxina mikolae CBS 423.85]